MSLSSGDKWKKRVVCCFSQCRIKRSWRNSEPRGSPLPLLWAPEPSLDRSHPSLWGRGKWCTSWCWTRARLSGISGDERAFGQLPASRGGLTALDAPFTVWLGPFRRYYTKLQTICTRRDYIWVAHNPSLILFLVQLVANFGHSSHFAAAFCFLASTPAKDIDLTHHCRPAELNKSAVKIPNVKPSVGANT